MYICYSYELGLYPPPFNISSLQQLHFIILYSALIAWDWRSWSSRHWRYFKVNEWAILPQMQLADAFEIFNFWHLKASRISLRDELAQQFVFVVNYNEPYLMFLNGNKGLNDFLWWHSSTLFVSTEIVTWSYYAPRHVLLIKNTLLV